MHVITGKTAAELREKYIKTFINCALPYYTECILQLKKYSDGECYTGYLWDCLKNALTITETQAFEKLHASENKSFFVMWDIHSCENIFIPNYWKYPKFAVIQVSTDELEKHLTTFPEDVYIFSPEYSWTVALTHEYMGQDRYCRYVDLR